MPFPEKGETPLKYDAHFESLRQLHALYSEKETGFLSYHQSTKTRKLLAIEMAASAIQSLGSESTRLRATTMNLFIKGYRGRTGMEVAIKNAGKGDIPSDLVTQLREIAGDVIAAEIEQGSRETSDAGGLMLVDLGGFTGLGIDKGVINNKVKAIKDARSAPSP